MPTDQDAAAVPAWIKAGVEVYEIHMYGRLTPDVVLEMDGRWAVLAESWHVAPVLLIPRAAVDEWERVRDALRAARGGCDSLLWLGNNMHNYGTPEFRSFLESAIADAQSGSDAAIPVLREVYGEQAKEEIPDECK